MSAPERVGVAWGWLVCLAGFVAYAALLAPPDDPALTRALVKGTFTGKFGTVDPSIAGWALFGALLVLGGWAIAAGSLTAYLRAFHSAAMVHVMTIDLCVCSGLLMMLVEEARARGIRESGAARRLRWIPLFGSAAWNALVRREP